MSLDPATTLPAALLLLTPVGNVPSAPLLRVPLARSCPGDQVLVVWNRL